MPLTPTPGGTKKEVISAVIRLGSDLVSWAVKRRFEKKDKAEAAEKGKGGHSSYVKEQVRKALLACEEPDRLVFIHDGEDIYLTRMVEMLDGDPTDPAGECFLKLVEKQITSIFNSAMNLAIRQSVG